MKEGIDNNHYLAELKGERPNRPYSELNCLLMVSLESTPYQDKGCLKSIISTLKKAGVKHLTVKIAGSINSTNYLFWDYYIKKHPEEEEVNNFITFQEETEEERREAALERGFREAQSWWETYKAMFMDILQFEPHVEYFITSLKSENFHEFMHWIEEFLEEKEFHKVFRAEVNKSTRRLEEKRKNPYIWFDQQDKLKAQTLNEEYLKKECADILMSWKGREYDWVFYVDPLNKCQKYLYHNYILSENNTIGFQRIAVKEVPCLMNNISQAYFNDSGNHKPINEEIVSIVYGVSLAILDANLDLANKELLLVNVLSSIQRSKQGNEKKEEERQDAHVKTTI